MEHDKIHYEEPEQNASHNRQRRHNKDPQLIIILDRPRSEENQLAEQRSLQPEIRIKEFLVLFSDACAEPGAVVIKSCNTLFAN